MSDAFDVYADAIVTQGEGVVSGRIGRPVFLGELAFPFESLHLQQILNFLRSGCSVVQFVLYGDQVLREMDDGDDVSIDAFFEVPLKVLKVYETDGETFYLSSVTPTDSSREEGDTSQEYLFAVKRNATTKSEPESDEPRKLDIEQETSL